MSTPPVENPEYTIDDWKKALQLRKWIQPMRIASPDSVWVVAAVSFNHRTAHQAVAMCETAMEAAQTCKLFKRKGWMDVMTAEMPRYGRTPLALSDIPDVPDDGALGKAQP